MPLKVVKRIGSQQLYVRGSVRGKSVFESAGTPDRGQAETYRAKREAELYDQSVFGSRAVVTFASAVDAYLDSKAASPTTITHVTRLVRHFKTTRLHEIGQEALDNAYRKILTKGIRASPATKMRAVLTPLRAILEFAAIRKWCDRPAFETPKIPRARTIFLRPDQATALIEQAAAHLRPLLVFLLGTGVRMSEALELQWAAVDLKGARATVWQKQGNERYLDLPPVVIAALSALPHRDGPVFRPLRSRGSYMDTGRTGGGQIKNSWSTACRKAGLPGAWRVWVPKGATAEKRSWVPEATPHSLRHTWASAHYCMHRDLLRLKDDGGWNTITMVTRYAKVMPAAYAEEWRQWLSGRPAIVRADSA